MKQQSLALTLDADGAWPDVNSGNVRASEQVQIGVLPGGTTKGKPVIAIRIDLPGGRSVIGFTTAKLFISASEAIKAKYGTLIDID